MKVFADIHHGYVLNGGGDNMMAAIGTGNVKPGIVTTSLGTSGTIYAYSSKPVVDPNGELAGFCDSTGAWLPLVCTMNVTVATELVRKAFGYSTKELNEAISKINIGSDGLILLPPNSFSLLTPYGVRSL